MILKTLTATGFKSFADKTEFQFEPGITCIVGPNGCGKSNVVDAVKWVLGEQSAKSLRGKQMLDVIFNGSGTRKSSGLAQVDLAFDNSDGCLPVDQAEVVVSRRLYRSGESEYLLNKQVCRLKDVRELFLDTGIGVDAYSVIEQGRVDVLLQANPADRRMIFEEAAGISKYKVRKKEAQRRLERVDQNLLRVQDIVEEVEKRLRSVKLAAGKARNYQAYSQRLRELRSTYALSEYHRLRVSRDGTQGEVDGLSDQATGLRGALSQNDTKTSDNNVRITQLEGELSTVDSRLLTVQSQITGHEERIAASKRRISDQTDLLERSRERLAGLDEQVAALDTRLQEQDEEAGAVGLDLRKAEDTLASLQEADRQHASELDRKRQRLEDEKAGIIDLLHRTSRLRNEIQGLNLHHESLTKQKAQLDERGVVLATELAEAIARQQQLQARRDEIKQLIEEQTAKLEETKERAAELARHRSAMADQHAAAKEYRSGLESRRQVLSEMDRRHEGLLTGAREILERRDADEDGRTFSYVLGAVGELFEADIAHASIVEAVLGSLEKHLVVTRRDQLLADREALAELSGRVQAYCLDCMQPVIGGPDMSGQEGFIANVLDWVRYPESCQRLARHLLGRTYAVESLEDARRLADMVSGSARFVTMEGIVWEPDGRIGLGSLGSDTGMISRRSELRELAKEVEEVHQRIDGLAANLRESETQARHLESVQADLQAAVYEAKTQRVEREAELSTVDEKVRTLTEERPLIASEVSVLVTRLQEMQEKESASTNVLSELEHQSSEGERAVEHLQPEVAALSTKRAAMGEEITAARVRIGELTQLKAGISETIRELQTSRGKLEADHEQANRDVVEARQRIEQSESQALEAQQTLAELTEENQTLLHRSMSLRQDRDERRQAVEHYIVEARRLRSQLEETESQLREREIKLQEVRTRLDGLVSRVADELSVNLEAQYEGYTPDDEQDWPAIEAEIESLRQKIDRLGNVNLDAITEQEELEKRLDFLTSQRDDLRSSERQLLSLIEKLNTESEQRFLETFTAVQGHFAALFRKLFGGGKAELSLMAPDNVLECGIEITARPPGKEPRSISLLSGGEKTLTAIALLLAVFRSRPSPFVLLDEVDAALDESNNVRFNHVIQEFVKHSQFIVITHAKRTMSIADVIYGVTMQEAGVSKRVSVRFEEEPTQAVA
ncbi:MAG: chromosome segregation protein SMC [Planctomycetota bacterium]